MNTEVRTKEDYTKFKRRMVKLANENEKLMDGTTAPVKEIIDGADIVFAVWQDRKAENGIDFFVIKGAKHLRKGIESNQAITLRFNAVKVIEYEMAVAACRTLGDNDQQQPKGLH